VNRGVARSLIGCMFVAAGLLVLGCNSGGNSGATGNGGAMTASADSAAVAQLRAGYVDAYNRKDPSAVASYYADDATEIEGNGMMLTGRAALADAFTKDTASWGKLTITPVASGSHFMGDIAYEVGSTTVDVMQNGKMVQIPGNYLVVLRKQAGEWKLAAVSAVPDSAALAAMMPPKGR
jgi:uncharacterized protein (TIGR02246 family)